MTKKCPFLALPVFLLFLLAEGLYAAEPVTIPGVTVGYMAKMQDLRVVGGLPRSPTAKKPKSGLRDLKVGDIFMNENNAARVVTSIYRGSAGQTVIETGAPRAEDVFEYVYVPDFDVNLGPENVDSLAPGVSLISGRTVDDPRSLFNEEFPGVSRDTVNWIDTDERIDALRSNGGKLTTLRVNLTLPIYSTDEGALSKLKKYKQQARDFQAKEDAANFIKEQQAKAENAGPPEDPPTSTTTKTGPAKGKGEADFKTEAKLRGVLTIGTNMQGGLKKAHFVDTGKKFLGIPIYKLEDGHVWFDFQLAQEFDFNLDLTMSLSYEYKMSLGKIMVADPSDTVEVSLELNWKTGIDGTLSIGLEISEYSYFNVGASADLALSFIPHHIETHSGDNYFNIAFRPTLAIEVEVKTGLYPKMGLKIAQIPIVSLEAGAGPYINGQGYAEPLGVVGYATGFGSYGNFRDWTASIRLEAGAFFMSEANLLNITKIPIWSHKWPFWTWSKNWIF
ncbi:MAG: hypothetical protein LBN21_13470 [Treponema sp.]|nr:hypothetical protein [Treponema sp.]